MKLNTDIDGGLNPKKFRYYFFDMDEDGNPELGVSDYARFNYVFKYDSNTDTFILWYGTDITWQYILGSRRIGYERKAVFKLINLNQQGDEKLILQFYVEGFYNDKTKQDDQIHMIGLKKEEINWNNKLSKKMIKQAYMGEHQSDIFYFRVTKQQWETITEDYFIMRDKSDEAIKEVTYTYEELFGTDES